MGDAWISVNVSEPGADGCQYPSKSMPLMMAGAWGMRQGSDEHLPAVARHEHNHHIAGSAPVNA